MKETRLPTGTPPLLKVLLLAIAMASSGGMAASSKLDASTADELKLITLAPGHFHAALFHKEMLPGVSERVHVYAPLGPDLLAHLSRVAQFNACPENPTRWQLEVHTGPDYWERLLPEHPGNVVVMSGNNRGKIGRIEALAQRRLHVLADKPWIIEPSDLPALQSAFEAAEENSVAIYDAMTQRFEISCILQRELVNDPNIFGARVAGSDAEPAVQMESVHYLLKEVAGMPSLRPAWFFDIRQQGEGLADVGTHLVDLVQWTLFPDRAIDHRANMLAKYFVTTKGIELARQSSPAEGSPKNDQHHELVKPISPVKNGR